MGPAAGQDNLHQEGQVGKPSHHIRHSRAAACSTAAGNRTTDRTRTDSR
jgi:hypothetical protein